LVSTGEQKFAVADVISLTEIITIQRYMQYMCFFFIPDIQKCNI